MDLLKQLSDLDAQIADLTTQRAEITSQLKQATKENGPMQGYGYMATWKPGRKSTNHEAAATAANVSPEIVLKHTKVKETVAWAKVTKEAGVDVAPFTTQGEPFFVVEVEK